MMATPNSYGPNYLRNPLDYGQMDFEPLGLQNPTPDWFTPNTIGTGSGNAGARTMTTTGKGTGIPYSQKFGGYGSSGQTKWGGRMAAIGEGVSAFSTLANLYLGFKEMGMMKDQFKFQKSAWTKNFAASLGSYDNTLRANYEKYKAGNELFNQSYQTKDEYMKERSLAYLGA